MPKKKLKLFHGPYNASGIAGFMSMYQEERGLKSDCIVYNGRAIFDNHQTNYRTKDKSMVAKFFIALKLFFHCITHYNTFHIYRGQSFFILGLDLPLLKLFGKKILMIYTGTDTRLLKDVEEKRNPYSGLFQFSFSPETKWPKNPILRRFKEFFVFRYNHPKFDNRKKQLMRWNNLWVDKVFAIRGNYANAAYIMNPAKIIKDININNIGVGKLDNIKSPDLVSTKDIPVLVHATTNRDVCGTKYIIEAVDQLKREGLHFEFLIVENTPYQEAKDIYENKADVIIDQMIVGDFGTFCIEGMIYGKPVVCYLMDDLVQNHYPDCPIVNANIDNLAEKLKGLIENKQLRIDLGKAGINYVKTNFDANVICDQMMDVYREIWKCDDVI
ncbi:MAG: hypothetical protein KDD41_08055 [Flavobacteriales bacterium]|nr:hypothetical protein [Flavobacteriales bacterium]